MRRLEDYDPANNYSDRADLEEALGLLNIWWWLRRGIAAAMVTLVLLMGGYPVYNVWMKDLRGQADLAEASWNRQIRIEEARAHKEAAQSLSQAEVIRAGGVAEANAIIADGLGGPEGYLRYLWIQALTDQSNQVIYVPTEAQIPILEAGRSVQP